MKLRVILMQEVQALRAEVIAERAGTRAALEKAELLADREVMRIALEFLSQL